MNKSDLIEIRSLLPEDKNFILATFLKGLYYGDSYYSEMKKSDFMLQYRDIVEEILNYSKDSARIACLKEDPNVILGYALINQENSILHFVFVKKSWRSIGIAKSLVPETVTTVTHLTKPGLSIMKSKGLVFNPFAA
jgi:hypothetical protein